MAKVFISYSRKDLSFVEKIVADLKKSGLDIWHDVSSLGGGSRWRIEIENAIRSSQFVIVVLSPDSIASEWVEREFLFASNLTFDKILIYCWPEVSNCRKADFAIIALGKLEIFETVFNYSLGRIFFSVVNA